MKNFTRDTQSRLGAEQGREDLKGPETKKYFLPSVPSIALQKAMLTQTRQNPLPVAHKPFLIFYYEVSSGIFPLGIKTFGVSELGREESLVVALMNSLLEAASVAKLSTFAERNYNGDELSALRIVFVAHTEGQAEHFYSAYEKHITCDENSPWILRTTRTRDSVKATFVGYCDATNARIYDSQQFCMAKRVYFAGTDTNNDPFFGRQPVADDMADDSDDEEDEVGPVPETHFLHEFVMANQMDASKCGVASDRRRTSDPEFNDLSNYLKDG
jgi:hypothetical protein